MSVRAMSKFSRVFVLSTGDRCSRPYMQDPMAPVATTECDRPVHSLRSNPCI